MGVNVLLFLVFQIGVEPWRRKRLVKGFEDKVMEALEREGSAIPTAPTDAIKGQELAPAEVQEAQEAAAPVDNEEAQSPAVTLPVVTESLPAPPTKTPPPVQEDIPTETVSVESSSISKLDLHLQVPMAIFRSIKEWIRDMFSERQIVLRRIDITTATLEGAAAGMTIVGTIVLLLRSR